jgi:hypothetical protein
MMLGLYDLQSVKRVQQSVHIEPSDLEPLYVTVKPDIQV